MKSLVTIKDYTFTLPLAKDNAVTFLDSAFSPFKLWKSHPLKTAFAEERARVIISFL